MSDIYTILGEITGFDVQEDIGKYYESYTVNSDGERVRNEKGWLITEMPNIVGMSIWINYIDKEYPEFYENIYWNAILGMAVWSQHKISALWIVLSYMFLKWKLYIHTELWNPKYLKNYLFSKEMGIAVIKNIDTGYFHINEDWLTEINIEKKDWWYNEKLSEIFSLIFWNDFLKIFELNWDEQRAYLWLRMLDYNNWTQISAWRLLFEMSMKLKDMKKTYDNIQNDCSKE